ncbi:MAG: terminase small subunit [Oscillospiraceae bacterium]|nr:terminase small subunit [Oscillospiraceae bacterium]
MTDKQRRFVEEYLVDLNATAAARRAGYKDPNKGRQLVTKSNVSAEIQAAMKQRSRRSEITQDRVLNELASVAFGEGSDENGSPLRVGNKIKALELLGKHLGMFDKDRRAESDDAAETGVVVMPPVMPPTQPPEIE